MDIESAIRQYLVERKETAPREQLELEIAALARLQEYLTSDEALDTAQAVKAGDLLAFIRSWYRDGDGVTPASALQHVAAVAGFAAWLDRQFTHLPSGPESASPRPAIAPVLAPLEETLPRVARAAELLRQYARREDLAPQLELRTEDGGSPLGLLGGATRVMRPAEIDYSRAEEDTFVVSRVDERSVTLVSPAREQLGEGAAEPVVVPAAVARLLREGDILHAEIAPASTEWEILHVETIYPGGWNDRP
jgi:hypothetical protein